jgi:hypothetical protein
MPRLSAPIFPFGGTDALPADDTYLTRGFNGLTFVLAGPGMTAEAGHLPVRGDLAHIDLAGRYFVPHYAVPQPRRVASACATLRKAGKTDAEAMETLPQGTRFNVLDIAGGWAWGQVGEHGFVGYVEMASLSEPDT